MSDAPFVPEPYVSHIEGWRAAYISIYGQIEDDPKLALYRDKAETTKKAKIIELQDVMARPVRLASRQLTKLEEAQSALIKACECWGDPEVYLFQENNHHVRKARKLKVSNALLEKLCAGDIKGYSPVVLSPSVMRSHHFYKLPMPGMADPIGQLGVWASDAGPKAIESGRVHWAFSEWDNVQERPLFFSMQELLKAFPKQTRKKQGKGAAESLEDRVVASLLRHFPEGTSTEHGSVKAARNFIKQEEGLVVSNSVWQRGKRRYHKAQEADSDNPTN